MDEENKDALNNLINSIQEKMNVDSLDNNTSNDEPDSSFDVSSLLNLLNGNNTQSKTSNSSDENSEFDPSFLLKIQKILNALNSSSPQKDLLLSLKPFLRKSRQDKMGEYITILSIISVLNSFKEKGSE